MALRQFDEWSDFALAARTVTQLCDEAILDADDRFIEDVARTAGIRGAVDAVVAIVPLEDPDRSWCMANHGATTAVRVLRDLAGAGSVEAQDHLRAIAVKAPWVKQALDANSAVQIAR